MKHCMITFRSVTPAQRGESALQRAGISCALQRTPRMLEQQGCGYCLKLPCSLVPQALELLGGQQIPYRKVYFYRPGDRPEEMHL